MLFLSSIGGRRRQLQGVAAVKVEVGKVGEVGR